MPVDCDAETQSKIKDLSDRLGYLEQDINHRLSNGGVNKMQSLEYLGIYSKMRDEYAGIEHTLIIQDVLPPNGYEVLQRLKNFKRTVIGNPSL